MRTSKLIFLVGIFTALFCLKSVSADTGNEIMSMCEQNETEAQVYCAAYINGIADGLSTHPNKVFCVPDNVTWQQIRDITLKFISDNAPFRHFHTALLVNTALSEAFPCSQ